VTHVSANGWPVLEQPYTVLWQVPQATRHFRLAPGAPGFLLSHLALWFHETIEPLDVGTWDDWAWSPPRPIRGGTTVSNHCSGTAVDLNSQLHPLGSRNTFRAESVRLIHRRLAHVYRGAIVWGGDWATRADEMHFEIAAGRSSVMAAANRLRLSPRGRRIRRANPGRYP